jgi:hypothetical protein
MGATVRYSSFMIYGWLLSHVVPLIKSTTKYGGTEVVPSL